MTKPIFLGLACAGAVLAAPAFADGPAVPETLSAPLVVAPPVPVPAQGSWTGFYAGVQLGFGSLETDLIGEGEEFDGGTLGFHAGYLQDFGSLVAGGEIDLETSNIAADASGVEVDSLARAKLRLGYDAGAFLPYAAAGIARAETSGALEAEDTGGLFGAGVEYRLTNDVRIGGEVLRHRFGDFGGTGKDLEATTASARVSFQF